MALWRVFHNDYVWRRVLALENYQNHKAFHKLAASVAPLPCVEKLNYILHTRVRRRWQKGQFTPTCLPLSERIKYGNNERYLVRITRKQADSWTAQVFDISGPGLRPLITQQLEMALKTDFLLQLNSILVAKHTALLCFSGEGNDAPQELIAFDLLDKFKELWRESISDWGHLKLPTLFGDGVYKLNLLTDKIEIYDVRTFKLHHSIPLVEEMRYPQGEISGDGKHLVIPGHITASNAPIISVWNIRTSVQRFLQADRVFCPFRWFEKTAVKQDRVYALLNRRSMFIWDANSGACLSEVSLSNARPGEKNPGFLFLGVSKSLVATIHDSNSSVGIFDAMGGLRTVLEPCHPHFSPSECEICDVTFTEHVLVVRFLVMKQPMYHVALYPLSLGSESILLDSPAPILFPLQTAEALFLPNLATTPTKLLHFAGQAGILLNTEVLSPPVVTNSQNQV
eukprot:TCALIF_12589-PA protein Name:"Protein of unknown function" AED:0.24 eAED:0.24 QI:0/0.33/0/0.75/1/1/4/0/453